MKSLPKLFAFTAAMCLSNPIWAAPKEPPEAFIRSAFQELLLLTRAPMDPFGSRLNGATEIAG